MTTNATEREAFEAVFGPRPVNSGSWYMHRKGWLVGRAPLLEKIAALEQFNSLLVARASAESAEKDAARLAAVLRDMYRAFIDPHTTWRENIAADHIINTPNCACPGCITRRAREALADHAAMSAEPDRE